MKWELEKMRESNDSMARGDIVHNTIVTFIPHKLRENSDNFR